MKTMIFAMIAAAALNASANNVTVQVCNQGESGVECRTVTYKQRAPSASTAAPVLCQGGEVGTVPCPKATKVPSWLEKLNNWFTSHGYTPAEQDNGVGGPS